MADEQLLAEQKGTSNGCIVAAVTGTTNHYTNNDTIKLKNYSNGDVNGPNLINLKNGSTNKIVYEFNINSNETPPISEPPDGGARAFCIMFSAFLCNSIIFGIINTCGTVYVKLVEYLQQIGDPEASSKAALVGSLALGTTFFLSPVSGILTDKIGLKATTFIGGVLMTAGMLLSSALFHNIYMLYITYGIMFGLGAALAYTPTIAILGHYFKRYLGLVSGFVTSGSSLFTVILPSVLTNLLNDYGLQTTFFIMGCSSVVVIVCALVYKPTQPKPPPPKRKPGQSPMSTFIMHLRSLVHVENFKRKRYVIWSLSIPIALLGYFVPYVHMPNYVSQTYPKENQNWPIMCIGLTSGVGRLIFGYIADRKGVNRILLQQISFMLLGLFTIAIPLVEYIKVPFINPFYVLLAISLSIGIVDGCFISLIGPVAYDLCGAKGATQGIGFLLGLCSIPITVGPPIAGFLFDQSRSYKAAFIMAGIPALIGAVLMTLIRCLRDERVDVCDKQAEDQFHKLLNKPAWTEDISIDIKEKNSNSYTFHKVNGGGQPKAVLTPDTTEFQIDGQDAKL